MSWVQITLHAHGEALATRLSDILEEIGALSVTLKDGADQPIYEPELNTTPLWQHTLVIALFDEDTDYHAVIAQLTLWLDPDPVPAYEVETLQDQEWTRVWMDNFHPMQFGRRVWICPSWKTPPDEEAVNILLDPGLAFGTGTHPTTALCLEWLDGQEKLSEQQQYIDYGCGSGILAIAAAKLGVQHLWCIDNDPQALIATQDNAEKNQVDQMLTLGLPDALPAMQADGIIANILAGVLTTFVELFADHLKDNAPVVLSGILEEQVDQVVAAYQTHFTITEVKILSGWARIVAHKNAT